VQQLRRVRRIAAQGRGRDVHIDWEIGTGLSFAERLPSAETKLAGRRWFPYKVPVADALFAMEIGAAAHDFIPNASLQPTWELGRGGRFWRFATRGVDPGNLEFRGDYLGKAAERGLPFSKKGIAVERGLSGKFVLMYLKRHAGPHDSRFDWLQR